MTVIGEMQLSIHKRYLRTNTQNTIVVNSTQYESHIRRRYSNLEIYLLPLTDTVQLITLIIESFLSSEQITLTLSVQRP